MSLAAGTRLGAYEIHSAHRAAAASATVVRKWATRSIMISQYVTNALARAHYRLLEDGTFAATIRGLKGVIATGTTLETCRSELAEVIEEWVLVRVARGLPVPTLGKAVVKVRRAS